jgi:WD40 repeat protein
MAQLDPAKAKVGRSYNHPGTFYGLAADFTAGRLYCGSDDNGIHVFDLASDKKEPAARWARHDNYVSALAAVSLAAKPVIVSGSYDRQLIWWDAEKGEPIRSVPAHDGWVRDVVASPDGNRIISAGDDMRVKVWETESGQLVHTLEGHAKRTPQGHVTALYAVAVSPDGKFLASGDRIGEVRVWEADTGKLAQTFQVPILYTYDPVARKRSIGGIRSLAFSLDGTLLAVGGIGQIGNVDGLAGPAHVEIWDWRKPQRRVAAGAEGHKALINQLRFHPEGGWLIGAGGGSDNGVLAFWKIDSLPETATDKKDALPVTRIKSGGHIRRFCLKPDGSELYAAGYQKLDVWTLDGASGK